MDNRFIVNRPIQPVKPIEQKTPGKTTKQQVPTTPFKEIMAEKLREKSGVNFSKHARDRLISRGIEVNDTDLQLLKNGVEKAREKGARDTLIMVNKVAYVVSVENKTVITAIDEGSIKENVFTNIDSAVFM